MNLRPERSFLIPLICGLVASALIAFSILGSREPRAGSSALASVQASLSEPQLSAEAYVVRIIGEQTPLAERRAGKRLAPASLTKLMTAAIAAEKLDTGDKVIVSAGAKAVGERRSMVETGETLSRDDLLRLALVASANDAALALAEAVGAGAGSSSFPERIQTFVRLMNGKARILGLDNTRFENPTGLDAAGHYASASDLARLAEYLLYRHPDLWRMTRSSETTAVGASGTRYRMAATNELLGEFPAIRGGKTGFTGNAKEALLLLYPVKPGRTAIVVILKSEDRFGDGRKVIRWLEEYGDRNQ